MRRAVIFLLAGVLTLGLAAGAMAWGGYGMAGGGYGCGGRGAQYGYNMGYAQGPGPNRAAPGYGPAYCPGWQARDGQQPQGYAPGYGPGQAPQPAPAKPAPQSGNLER